MKWKPQSGRSPILGATALCVAMAAIFVADTVTDYAIAAAVFYTTVILVAIRVLSARVVVALAGGCVGLTILSFALTHSGAYEVGLINTAISIVAISVTTYLALKLVAAEGVAHESRERLLRMARVVSLGELTASIAHEVNQPLTAVVTSAGAGKRWLDHNPPNIGNTRRTLDRIVDEANRASAVVARVRGFANGKPPHRTRFALNELVSEVVALARGQIAQRNIEVRLHLHDELPMIDADRVQIGQVVGNLLLNAIEAVAARPAEAREIEINSMLESTGTVRLTVGDKGVGFRPGEIEHLFDAFWTTKRDGIGLGLTISRSIIEANGGRIWAEGNEGQGAMFVFNLPIAADQANA